MTTSPSREWLLERRPWIGSILIVIAVVLAWSNSFSAPFELDDDSSIASNESIRNLASFHWLKPPSNTGATVSGRPVLNLSFAINYALTGLDVRGYHVTNLAIHALAALTLFGLVRRSLLFSPPKVHSRRPATLIALAVALVWGLHPVQTQCVTYIVQRAESLMSLFYLLTLYGFVRSAKSNLNVRNHFWSLVSWSACLLGMATKENMVSAPLVVLLLDRALVTGSLRTAWQARRSYYLALASTWVLLAGLVASTGGNRGGTSGFDVGVGWLSYALTQLPAITRYLSLSFWPHPLIFEYGPYSVDHIADVARSGLLVGALVIGTVYALWRYPKTGVVSATAFAILAPTSLVPGTLQMISEHRMYLPLASVVVAVCVGGEALTRRWGQWLFPALAGVAALVLGEQTFTRNRDYRSPLSLWQDTVVKAPQNPRAHNNLGCALLDAQRVDDAIAEFRRTIELKPNHAFAHFNLGNAYGLQHRWVEGADQYNAALAADPHYENARVNLGQAFLQLGRKSEAIEQFRTVLKDDNAAQDVRTNLAALLIADDKVDEGVALLREVLVASPRLAEAHYHLGLGLEKSGSAAAAENEFREAVRLKPPLAEAHLALGNTAMGHGDVPTAEASYREAIRLDSHSAEAQYALGNLLAQQQQFETAMNAFREALKIDPGHIQAQNNLANCQLVTGALSDAITNYEAVLRLRPQDDTVKQNLEIARQMLRAKVR